MKVESYARGKTTQKKVKPSEPYKPPAPPKRPGKFAGETKKKTKFGYYKWLESETWVWLPLNTDSGPNDPKEYQRLHVGRKNRKMRHHDRKLF